MRQPAPVVFLLGAENKMRQRFEDEGVEKFNKPFDMRMETWAKTSARQGREVP